MTLDASNKQLISIDFRILNKICRCLFGGDGNQRYALVSGFEPDDLRAFNRATSRFIPAVTLPFPAFSLLFLFGSSRRWTEKTKCPRKELSRHPFDDCHDMPSKLRLDFVGDPEDEC